MLKAIELLQSSDLLGLKKHLQAFPALIDEEDEQGASLLANALKEHCDSDIIDLLIDMGCDIHAYDDEGVNILEYAITYGQKEFVKYLLKEGISPNETKRRSGFTPLMAAVCYNHLDMVKIFMEEGVDVSARDNSGFTALDFARRMHRKKVLTYLQGMLKEND